MANNVQEAWDWLYELSLANRGSVGVKGYRSAEEIKADAVALAAKIQQGFAAAYQTPCGQELVTYNGNVAKLDAELRGGGFTDFPPWWGVLSPAAYEIRRAQLGCPSAAYQAEQARQEGAAGAEAAAAQAKAQAIEFWLPIVGGAVLAGVFVVVLALRKK